MMFDPQVCFFWEGEFPARHIEPLRRIYETELVYLSHGTYDLEVEKSIYALAPGSIALIPPGLWHESRCGTKGHVLRHCVHFEWQPGPPRPGWQSQSFVGQPFDVKLISPVPAAFADRLPLVVTLEPNDGVRRILELALQGMRRGETMGRYLLWPVLNALLTPREAQSAASRPSQRSKVARAVMKVRDYIDIHHGEPHGYEVYSELSGLSPSHLCQAFKRLFGRTPTDYLNDLRLSQAYRIINESRGRLTVTSTAWAVGIRDPNYFARIFRRRFGITPSAHARQAKRHHQGRCR